ncbi:MAG: hypothetical protein V1493_01880, partial [Candidatus Diapherotrites archaeon]
SGKCKTWLLCECQCLPENEGCYNECLDKWQEKLGAGFDVKVDLDNSARAFAEGDCKEESEGVCSQCEFTEIEGCIDEEQYTETGPQPD